MDCVNLTDEMQNRIISSIDSHFSKKHKTCSKYRRFPKFVILAATVTVICVVGLRNSQNGIIIPNDDISDRVESIYGRREYESHFQLEEAAGFYVPELRSVPFKILDTLYAIIGKDLAEIRYIGDKDQDVLIFRKSIGLEENSGDYNYYSMVEDVQIDNITITQKGYEDLIFLAYWFDGKYFYSIGISSGCSREVMEQLILEAMEK